MVVLPPSGRFASSPSEWAPKLASIGSAFSARYGRPCRPPSSSSSPSRVLLGRTDAATAVAHSRLGASNADAASGVQPSNSRLISFEHFDSSVNIASFGSELVFFHKTRSNDVDYDDAVGHDERVFLRETRSSAVHKDDAIGNDDFSCGDVFSRVQRDENFSSTRHANGSTNGASPANNDGGRQPSDEKHESFSFRRGIQSFSLYESEKRVDSGAHSGHESSSSARDYAPGPRTSSPLLRGHKTRARSSSASGWGIRSDELRKTRRGRDGAPRADCRGRRESGFRGSPQANRPEKAPLGEIGQQTGLQPRDYAGWAYPNSRLYKQGTGGTQNNSLPRRICSGNGTGSKFLDRKADDKFLGHVCNEDEPIDTRESSSDDLGDDAEWNEVLYEWNLLIRTLDGDSIPSTNASPAHSSVPVDTRSSSTTRTCATSEFLSSGVSSASRSRRSLESRLQYSSCPESIGGIPPTLLATKKFRSVDERLDEILAKYGGFLRRSESAGDLGNEESGDSPRILPVSWTFCTGDFGQTEPEPNDDDGNGSGETSSPTRIGPDSASPTEAETASPFARHEDVEIDPIATRAFGLGATAAAQRANPLPNSAHVKAVTRSQSKISSNRKEENSPTRESNSLPYEAPASDAKAPQRLNAPRDSSSSDKGQRRSGDERRINVYDSSVWADAWFSLWREQQYESFAKTRAELNKFGAVLISNRYAPLAPTMYDDDIIRSNSRVRYQDSRPFERRCPILAHPHHPTTLLFMRYLHVNKLCHSGGASQLLDTSHNYIWVVNGRSLANKVIQDCVSCKRQNARHREQIMAPLPSFRLPQSGGYPFEVCSVDAFGPINVKYKFGTRADSGSRKRWVILYTCCATRAIHLEVAENASTDAFFSTLDRFIMRRQQPRELRSDSGTNFIGARRLFRLVQKEGPTRTQYHPLKWSLNTPYAPHTGGVHERLVRSAKLAMYAQLKEERPSDFDLLTIVTRVEGILNDRPLTFVSSHTEDPEPLTPNLLLKGSKNSYIEPTERSVARNFIESTNVVEKIWNRFIAEMAPSLMTVKRKFLKAWDDIKKGDVVVLLDPDERKAGKWPLARVLEVRRGTDGFIRTVALKFRDRRKPMERPFRYVFPLPQVNAEDEDEVRRLMRRFDPTLPSEERQKAALESKQRQIEADEPYPTIRRPRQDPAKEILKERKRILLEKEEAANFPLEEEEDAAEDV